MKSPDETGLRRLNDSLKTALQKHIDFDIRIQRVFCKHRMLIALNGNDGRSIPLK